MHPIQPSQHLPHPLSHSPSPTSLFKFSGSSLVFDQMKLGGFILWKSRILKVLDPSCRAPLCCLTWLVITWLSIMIASQNFVLVTTPRGCTSCSFGTHCSSTSLHGWPMNDLLGGMMIWNIHVTSNYRLEIKSSHERNRKKGTTPKLRSILIIDVERFTPKTKNL